MKSCTAYRPNTAAVLILLAGICTSTKAQEGVVQLKKLRDCAQLQQPMDRLSCFEQLIPRAAGEPASAANPASDVQQQQAQEASLRAIRTAVDISLEPNYVVFGQGLRLHGDDSTRHLLYEAQIVKNVHLLDDRAVKDGFRMRIDVPLRFVVRQLTIDSKPVRTPTYNPGIRAYFYQLPERDAARLNTFSLGFFHYSNGQEGPPLRTDGRVNTENGSFNTNYVELAWMQSRPYSKGLLDSRLSFRQDFYRTWDEAQPEQYPKRQLRAEARLAKEFLGQLQPEVRLALDYRMGYQWRVWNPVHPEQNLRLRTRDRFQLSIEARCEVCWGGQQRDFGLFFRYDVGYDPYNIRFSRPIHRLGLGLTAVLDSTGTR